MNFIKRPTYLIAAGGLGNIYYQLNQVARLTDNNFQTVTLLYSRFIRRCLAHSQTMPAGLVIENKASQVVSFIILAIAMADVLLFKAIGKTVFTVLDTTNFKYSCPPVKLIYYGYFQGHEHGQFSKMISLADLLDSSSLNYEPCEHYDCVHFRYGDYMTAHKVGSRVVTNMPRPDLQWYQNALHSLRDRTRSEQLVVVTDNIEGASDFFRAIDSSSYESIRIQSLTIDEDLSTILGCVGLVNFNSTLSLMAFEESRVTKFGIFSEYLGKKAMSAERRKLATFM